MEFLKRNQGRKYSQFTHFLAVSVVIAWTTSLWADEPIAEGRDAEIAALKAQIQLLAQKVEALEKARATFSSTNSPRYDSTAPRSTPKISIGEKGFSMASADGDFAVQLRGVLQLDSRTYFDDGGVANNNGFLLRRARPILQGTVYRDFDFLFVPEFGTGSNGGAQSTPQIFDAYVNYRLKPELQLRFGKFKSPIGLEQLQSDVDLLFNERTLATDLVPNRDVGVQLWGDLIDGRLTYAVGLFNGVGDNRSSTSSDIDDSKAVEGRLFAKPFNTSKNNLIRNIGFGIAGSYEDTSGAGALPSGSGYVTDGQQQFFSYRNTAVADGTHWRLVPQAYYYVGPFGLLGEYVLSSQRLTIPNTANSEQIENCAWQITGSWIVTGEDASYGAVSPKHPFRPFDGQWGALQLAARYSQLYIDEAAFPTFANAANSAQEADAWGVSMIWWLNRNLRVSCGFSRTTFDGLAPQPRGAAAAVAAQAENVFFTRLQLSF